MGPGDPSRQVEDPLMILAESIARLVEDQLREFHVLVFIGREPAIDQLVRVRDLEDFVTLGSHAREAISSPLAPCGTRRLGEGPTSTPLV